MPRLTVTSPADGRPRPAWPVPPGEAVDAAEYPDLAEWCRAALDRDPWAARRGQVWCAAGPVALAAPVALHAGAGEDVAAEEAALRRWGYASVEVVRDEEA